MVLDRNGVELRVGDYVVLSKHLFEVTRFKNASGGRADVEIVRWSDKETDCFLSSWLEKVTDSEAMLYMILDSAPVSPAL